MQILSRLPGPVAMCLVAFSSPHWGVRLAAVLVGYLLIACAVASLRGGVDEHGEHQGQPLRHVPHRRVSKQC